MGTRTRAQREERAEAIAKLREWIKPGDTVYTVLDSVSRSGMSRHIRVVVPYLRDDDTIDHLHPNHAVALAIDARQTKRGDALVIGGCGMDMGFHVVNSLSEVLYGYLRCEAPGCGKYPSGEYRTVVIDGATDRGERPPCEYCGAVLVGGYACLGKGKCPSNYHVNHRDRLRCEGTRVYNPDGPDSGEYCWRPDFWRIPDQAELRAKWPRRRVQVQPADADGPATFVDAGPLACIGDLEAGTLQVCPTCGGEGDVPNPAGPERWDLLHTDGYAVRQRWL